MHICAVEFIGFHTLSTNNNKLDINVLGTPSFPLLGGRGESGTYSKTPLDACWNYFLYFRICVRVCHSKRTISEKVIKFRTNTGMTQTKATCCRLFWDHVFSVTTLFRHTVHWSRKSIDRFQNYSSYYNFAFFFYALNISG